MTTVDVEADVGVDEPQGDSSLLQRLSDRLNPILLKEVRQAMRGRYFKYSFWFTLLVATLIGLFVVLITTAEGHEEDLGPAFYGAMFGCLVLATQVLVPFSAFLSMGGEWDENTWDLLVLSNLKPRQIVYGKVLSAGVQALLFYSAFGPFLVFAFLLRGIDVGVLGVTLAVSLVMSLLLSCLATAMSSLSRGRFARVVLMVLLAVALIWASGGVVLWAAQLMFQPGLLHDPDMLNGIGAALTVGLAVAAFFFAAATARLAHPEENRSTGLRLTALGVIVAGLGWISWTFWDSRLEEPVIGGVCMALAALGLASILFTTEPERLGRRVAVSLPRNPLLAWLALPLYPGGARGLLFFVLGGGLVLGWAAAMDMANPNIHLNAGQDLIGVVLLAYGLIYIGLPSGLASWGSDRIGVRLAARVAVFVFLIASILLPALFGFLAGIKDWADFEHPGNLFVIVDDLWSNRNLMGSYIFVLGFGVLLTLVVNAPRLGRMLREWNAAVTARSDGG